MVECAWIRGRAPWDEDVDMWRKAEW
jgi:hypothetical protein